MSIAPDSPEQLAASDARSIVCRATLRIVNYARLAAGVRLWVPYALAFPEVVQRLLALIDDVGWIRRFLLLCS